MWAVFPLQDALAVDAHVRSPDPHGERINVPGQAAGHWRWRAHITLEELNQTSAGAAVASTLREMAREAGRSVA
jgi:4-alpha-glucanotransferase